MKFIKLLIVLILHCMSNSKASAINHHLLPRKALVCSNEVLLAFKTIKFYFKNQHSMTVIDFSKEPDMTTFACVEEEAKFPLFLFDDWKKVNFGQKIDESALSAYPTSRGFYIKCHFFDSLNLLPLISSYNPRAKLLITLDYGTLKEAEKLLEVAFHQHKMLQVAVFLSSHIKDKELYVTTNYSLCSLNPFLNEAAKNGKFKCFNITNFDPQFDEIGKFISSRIINLHKYPLRIEIYEEPLLSKAVKNEHGEVTNYKFADGDSVMHLAERMNFTPVYVNLNDDTKHGYQLPNGSFTGSLGSIEDGKADFAAIPIMISNFKTKKSLFLNPIAVKNLYFVIRKRDVVRMIMIGALIESDVTTKALTVVFFFIFPIIYIAINKIETKIKCGEKKSATRNLFYVLSLLSNVSAKHSKLSASRLVVLAILFFALIMTSLFQGTIIKILNRNKDMNRIKTVQELVSKDYKLTVDRSWATVFKNQTGSYIMDIMRKISNDRKHIVNSTSTGLKLTMLDKQVAFLVPDLTTETLIEYFDEKTGDDIFDYLPQPVYSFYVSPMVPKNSPFIDIFNYWLVQYRETGMQRKQINIMEIEIDKIIIHRIANGNVPQNYGKKSFIQWSDLRPLFCVYLILASISVATFLMEILCFSIGKSMKTGNDFQLEFVL